MKAILALVLISIAAPGQQPTTGNLQGVVTAEGSNTPIANAELLLIWQSARGDSSAPPTRIPPFRSLTDATGKFSFNGVPFGAYRLTVQASGHIGIGVGARTVVVTPSENSADIAVRLVPTGLVSGRVQDSSGRPIPDIEVSFLRRVYDDFGRLTFSPTAAARTNDLGEYRMWMAPGKYMVRAGSARSPATNSSQQDEGYSHTFYPGVGDESRAAMIDVRPAAEIRGIDFSLVRGRLYRIRGRIVNSSTGQPAFALGELARLDSTGGHTTTGSFLSDDTTGVVDIGNLSLGTYMLTAVESVSFGGANAGQSISKVVVIGDADITDLTLAMTPYSRIDGHLQVEGALPASVSLAGLSIVLFPRNASDLLPRGGRAAAGGAFTLYAPKDVDLRLTLLNLPQGLFLKAARLNGMDVLSSFSSFAIGGNLEVVISANGGSIEGRAVDAQLGAVPEAQVVLVPNSSRTRPDLFKAVKADNEGRFRISDIAPGDYRVFAWPAIEERLWFDPEVLRRYEPSAKLVHVEESSRQNLNATVMAAPQ